MGKFKIVMQGKPVVEVRADGMNIRDDGTVEFYTKKCPLVALVREYEHIVLIEE